MIKLKVDKNLIEDMINLVILTNEEIIGDLQTFEVLNDFEEVTSKDYKVVLVLSENLDFEGDQVAHLLEHLTLKDRQNYYLLLKTISIFDEEVDCLRVAIAVKDKLDKDKLDKELN